METETWEHDENRDGGGCTWCGAFAQVDSDNLCRECWDADALVNSAAAKGWTIPEPEPAFVAVGWWRGEA